MKYSRMPSRPALMVLTKPRFKLFQKVCVTALRGQLREPGTIIGMVWNHPEWLNPKFKGWVYYVQLGNSSYADLFHETEVVHAVEVY